MGAGHLRSKYWSGLRSSRGCGEQPPVHPSELTRQRSQPCGQRLGEGFTSGRPILGFLLTSPAVSHEKVGISSNKFLKVELPPSVWSGSPDPSSGSFYLPVACKTPEGIAGAVKFKYVYITPSQAVRGSPKGCRKRESKRTSGCVSSRGEATTRKPTEPLERG